MKLTFLLTAVSVVAASIAMAGPAPKTIKCAVMSGRDVDVKAATANHMYADYKGNRYFFCCGGCPAAFKKDPAKFAKAPHIATPKATKKAA